MFHLRKIINGKTYNTDTAIWLAGWRRCGGYADLNYIEQNLYKTKSGFWFLHVKGGANTKYCKRVGQNEWVGGETIMPISDDDACRFAEEHRCVDSYDEVWGEIGEA